MGKKRKASGRVSTGPKEFDPKDGKLGPITTYEDVADSEDEFHIQRDKVLLDDAPEAKRRRKAQEEDARLEESDEEILGYDESEDDDKVDDDDEESEVEDARDSKRPNKSSRDEEQNGEEDEEEVGGWGSSRKDYYDADQIETEADARMEEEEALRLQQKKLSRMTEEDFGLDEWMAGDEEKQDGEDGEDVIREELKDVQITPDMSNEEKMRILRARYPEFDALADDFLQLKPQLEELQTQSEANGVTNGASKPRSRTDITRYRALTAYVASLAMYFALLTSPSKSSNGTAIALNPRELHEHPVMESILKCRELWLQVKDLKAADLEQEEASDPAIELDVSDEDQFMEDAEAPAPKKTKKELKREAAAAEAARARAERIAAAAEEIQDLSSLMPKSRRASKAASKAIKAADSDSDFGEEEFLSARSAAEKEAKKKSLRFYTSQIAQKASKRADAGRDAGGDADLPYRERFRDRQARLNAEAEARGRKLDEYGRGKGRGTELGGDDSDVDEEQDRTAKEVRDADDEYYDMVAMTSRKKKQSKAEHAAAVAAAEEDARLDRVAVDGDVDGKRAIGYVIEKNKGLAPKRKKDVRNPRVKKRKKFEERKKKLASMRPTYKGGEERGGYGGEKTGIKTGLVKSVKL
jgi:U3 small nucleolar RNA-associated protein 3